MQTKHELAVDLDTTLENALLLVTKWRTDNPRTIDYRVEGIRQSLMRAIGFNNDLLTDEAGTP